MSDVLLTSREAAALLNYRNPKSFNRAVHRLGMPHRYAGGRLAFDRARLLAWVATYTPKKRGPKPKPALQQQVA